MSEECVHMVEKDDCIYCSPKYQFCEMVVVYCEKCSANTWHKNRETCCVCQNERDREATHPKDLNLLR